MDGEHFGERGDVIAKFKVALNQRFGEAIFASWFSDLGVERLTDDGVTLSTESQLKCDTINQRFTMMLREVWSEEINPIRKMSVVTRKSLKDGAARVNGMTVGVIATGAGFARRPFMSGASQYASNGAVLSE